MRKLLACSLILLGLILCMQLPAQTTGTTFTKHAANKWFNKKEWLGGANLKPHSSIDKKEFARQYRLNKTYWVKAFAFLKEHNLNLLPKGKYLIDSDNVTAAVTDTTSKDFDKTTWESHLRYIDLQCIRTGEEKMGVYRVVKSEVIKAYDDNRDIANYNAPGKFYVAGSRTFFLFFPSDAHRPNITPGGDKDVKKVVLKIRAAEQG